MNNTTYSPNYMLNSDITLEEAQRVVDKVQIKKAEGVDDLPNEALKTPNMLNILCRLFQKCFQYGITLWNNNQIIIRPTPG